MNWLKLTWLMARRLGRAAFVLAVAAATVGGMLLGATPADAAIGTQPGTVNLVPPTGPTSTTPTWQTTIACPSGFQGSAILQTVTTGGTTFNASAFVNGVGANPITGMALQAPMSTIQSVAGFANGNTNGQEFFVTCWSGASGTGSSMAYQNIFVYYDATGANYSTSATTPGSFTATATTTR
jgi:hypothetical protein